MSSTANAQDVALPAILVEAASPISGLEVSEAYAEFGTLIVVDDAFVPVTVVPEGEVLRSSGANLTDAIDGKPGIFGSTFAGGASRPIIRGLDNIRVRVQENGIGSHDVSTLSEDHAVPIDPFAADRIEVIRGPATLRYGSGAIGGVVAAENGRIPTAIPAQGVKGQVIGGLTSVDDGHEGAVSVTAGAGGIAVHFDAFKRDAEDYDTPNGRQLNSFVEAEGYSIGSSHIWSTGYIGVAYTRYESFYGIPGEEAAEHRPRIDLEQDKVLAKGEWRVRDSGIDTLRFWFGVSDYAHDEVIFEEDEGVDAVGNRFTNEEAEARIEVSHLPAMIAPGKLTGAVGVHYVDRDTRGQSFEGDSLLEPANTNSIAGYVFEELEVSPALTFQAAGRLEHVEVDGANRLSPLDPSAAVVALKRDFTPASGSLGLRYRLPKGIVLTLTGQYAERAPEVQELFSKGIHEATGTFEIGNPGLDKEVARSVEFGVRRAKGPLRFDATAFYTEFDGFIFKQLTGVTCGETIASCGVEDELDQVLFSQLDATFYGAEIAVQYDVAKIWRGVWGVDGQFDVVRAEFDDGDNVPRIPPHRLGGGLFYRGANTFARFGVLHAFDQDDVNRASGELTTPGYTLVSAELSYTGRLPDASGHGTEYTIGIKGENLADDEVLNHASFKRREDVLLPGASVKVFAKVKLN